MVGADQIAVIRPALAELRHALENGEPDADRLCMTFTLSGREDVWIQVMAGAINIAYPHQRDPTSFLESSNVEALPGLVLVAHEPRVFATWSHAACSLRSVARFVGDLLTLVHELEEDRDDLDVVLERL